MNIFIDKESADRAERDLISSNLVTESGQTFYASCKDYGEALHNDFLCDKVAPLLGATGTALRSRVDRKLEVVTWVAKFERDRLVICYDYMGDLALLWDLWGKQAPRWLTMRNIRKRIDQIALENFFTETGLARHHALNDARGNATAYRPGRTW